MFRRMARKPLVPAVLMQGPFALAEARRAGLQRWHLEGASWTRLTRSTYIRAGAETTLLILVAASRRFPATAAFSGLTAAWLHGLEVSPCDPVEVTVPAHIGVTRPVGVRVRRALLPEGDVVRLRQLRGTSMVRTIADLSARLSLTEATVIADAALHSGRVTRERLNAWAAAHSCRPGIRRLRKVIELADAAAESQMETRLRMLLRLGGLPPPKAQVPVFDAAGRFVGRPDLYFEEARLGIEYDGGAHKDSLVADNHRQNNLLGAGVRLVRFTAIDVVQDPESVVLSVKAMLGN